jgi:hypothetical protein
MTKTVGSVPVITGNFAPYRLVMRDSDSWSPSFDEVVGNQYDFGRLFRVSTGVDIGIRPLSMLVCFDGTLAIPMSVGTDPDKCLQLFNKTLSEALMGGLYCEAMSPDDLCFGEASYHAYCRHNSTSRGPQSSKSLAFRTRTASPFDILGLWRPEVVSVDSFHQSIWKGRDRLAGIEADISSAFLYGCTFYARCQWSEALLHLWTTSEQILSQIWKDEIVNGASIDGISTKDRRAFLEDSRTWSASTIIEVLFQTGKLDAQIYLILNTARKARNAFVHRSATITREIAQAALSGAIELASIRLAGTKNEFHANEIISLVETRSRSPLGQRMKGEDSPQYVARLPVFPAPSFPEWGDQPYEVIEEFCFERVDQSSIHGAG